MKCKYVDTLLPLYVGSDLEEERSRLVAAHLGSCTACARAADEYAGANQLLHRYEAPFFTDETFADIRRQVLNEIERKSRAPLWSSLFPQSLFGIDPNIPRWITAALLIAVSVAVLYLSRNRSSRLPDEQHVAGTTRAGEPDQPDAGVNVRSPDTNGSSSSLSKKRPDLMAARDASVTGKKKGRVDLVAANSSREKPTKIDSAPKDRVIQRDLSQLPSSAPASLRVEMQTRDQNIRIIWLYSEAKPGVLETSKGI